ncbi:MAG: hypothetical protein WBI07_19995 [Mobilitalea sp.]
MALLKNIMEQIEKTFKVHIHGSLSSELQIDSIQFLLPEENDNSNFLPSTLYIGNYQDFCDQVLEGNILLLNCRTSQINDNGLYIYKQLNPMEVCNCIQKEIYRSYQIKLKTEELFHILHTGYGLQAIIHASRSYLENPVTICNTSFSIIACSPLDDANNNFEVHNNKRYLKKSSLENMRSKKVMDHLFKNHTPLIAHFDEDPNTEYLFCSIYIRRATVGYICIRSDIRSFTEEDLSFVMDLSQILSIEMQKDEFFIQKSGLKYDYFLTDLLERNLDDIEFATQHLIQLGQEFYQYFWVLTFSFSGEASNHMKPNYYINQLLSIFHNSMAFFYKGTLVLLLTSKNTDPYLEVDLIKFNNFLHLNQMYSAISYRYEYLLDTYLYYEQAMFLLKDKKMQQKDRIYSYSDNYLFHLLSQSRFPIKAFIHPDINYLLTYCIWRDTPSGFAKQNGCDAERASTLIRLLYN